MLAGSAVGLLIAAVVEYFLHMRCLRTIPLRVHVNGTRGKSTTTRLIAAGLRAGGLRVLAKTTGSAARIIFPDGSEKPVNRRGSPTISEQMRLIGTASRLGCDALVVECMALSPETQWISEHRIIQSTIGVITNVREDHFDVMGPTLNEAAAAIARTIPRAGRLVTAETGYFSLFAQEAEKLGTAVDWADPSEIPSQELEPFTHLPFAENIACALRVCQLAGVSRETALRGMWDAQADPGVSRIYRICRGDREIYFVNALAANDCQSTGIVYKRTMVGALAQLPVAGVLNARSDRPLRLAELVSFAKTHPFDCHIMIGQGNMLARRVFIRSGVECSRMHTVAGAAGPAGVIQRIAQLIPGSLVLFAYGNIKGAGEQLARYFEENGEVMPW